jgi:hypothetical protein
MIGLPCADARCAVTPTVVAIALMCGCLILKKGRGEPGLHGKII